MWVSLCVPLATLLLPVGKKNLTKITESWWPFAAALTLVETG
jgi:hypothetical protein